MNSARNSGRANKRTPKRDPLPDDFGSYEAAAEFWDTHDLTDYEDSERDVANVQINLVRRYQPVKSNLRATSFMNNENPFAQVRLRPHLLRATTFRNSRLTVKKFFCTYPPRDQHSPSLPSFFLFRYRHVDF